MDGAHVASPVAYPFRQADGCFEDATTLPADVCVVVPDKQTQGDQPACVVGPTGAAFWVIAPINVGFCSAGGWYGKASPYCGGVTYDTSVLKQSCLPTPTVPPSFDPAIGCPACPNVARSCP